MASAGTCTAVDTCRSAAASSASADTAASGHRSTDKACSADSSAAICRSFRGLKRNGNTSY